MDKIKLAILAGGLSLALGACQNMMGDDRGSPTMEPAAGPSTMGNPDSEPGMTTEPGDEMLDSDDQEGAGSAGGGGPGAGTGAPQ